MSPKAHAGDPMGQDPCFQGGLIFDQLPDRPHAHASTLTQLPNGDLMAAWFGGSGEKGKDVAILFSRLAVGAGQWTQPEILNDAQGLSEGNPVLFTAPDGKIWFFYLVMYGDTWNSCKIHYRTSTDGGETWGDEMTLIAKKGYAIRNRPIILNDGAMLFPAANEMLYTPLFLRTTDGFEHVKRTGVNLRFGGGLDQPALAQLSDGRVLALFRHAGGIIQSFSTDGGLTWSRPEPTQFPNPDAGIALTRLGNGNLVLVFNDSPTSRSPLTVAISEDDGKTWPLRRDIETEPGQEFSYPCVIQSADGLIHVTYTYKRETIKHVVFNQAWIMAGGNQHLQ